MEMAEKGDEAVDDRRWTGDEAVDGRR